MRKVVRGVGAEVAAGRDMRRIHTVGDHAHVATGHELGVEAERQGALVLLEEVGLQQVLVEHQEAAQNLFVL